MRKHPGQLVYAPTDLVRYLASPFASWMDRYYLGNPNAVTPDKETEDEKLIAQTGDQHERAVLDDFKLSVAHLVVIPKEDPVVARDRTLSAINSKTPIIYQAALGCGRFAGFADFLTLDASGRYQVWDTKLARSPKPYYAIQLCCYHYSDIFHLRPMRRSISVSGVIEWRWAGDNRTADNSRSKDYC